MARLALLAVGATLVSAASVTKIKLGMDVNYPPYAYKEGGVLKGFGKDIADGMTALCADLEIEVVETKWANCWNGSAKPPTIGAKLADGTLDACTTYTHTKGVRNQHLDFSGGILNVNKAAGLLTLLDANGKPKVTGCSNLVGVKVVDVAGWAPTADTIAYVENKCAHSKYSTMYTMLSADKKGNMIANDHAMNILRDGDADAMFVYADQAKNYQCKGLNQMEKAKNAWNCSLWEGFGKDYAYVQTGQFGYVFNGTTLAITKKGSGVEKKLNPCLWKYMNTKAYYDVCRKHDQVESCYHNSHFPPKSSEKQHEYNKDTDQHKGDCSSGYCPCPADTMSKQKCKNKVFVPEHKGVCFRWTQHGVDVVTKQNKNVEYDQPKVNGTVTAKVLKHFRSTQYLETALNATMIYKFSCSVGNIVSRASSIGVVWVSSAVVALALAF